MYFLPMSYISNSNVFLFYSYLTFLFLSLNSSNLFMFWLFLECLTVVFILIVYLCGKESCGMILEQCFFYFLIQSIGSITLLYSFNFSMKGDFSSFLIIMAIILKMGIFPFHSWVYKLSHFITPLALSVLLSFQKMPLILFLVYLENGVSWELVFFSSLWACFILSFCKDFLSIIISSSIYLTVWLMCFLGMSFWFFLFFLSFYFLFNFIFLESVGISNPYASPFFGLFSMFFLLFLMGLPPLSFFFFKFYSLAFIMGSLSLPGFSFLWLMSYICLVFYFKNFFLFFLKDSNLFTSHNSSKFLFIFFSGIFFNLLFLF